MYTYVSALARTKGSNSAWGVVDISTMPLYQVYATYSDIKAVVTNPVISGDLSVDFADLPETLRILSITFPQWLVTIGNQTLPTTANTGPVITATVRHRDAWYWGFNIKPANHTKHPDVQLMRDEQVDLFMVKPGVDPLEIQKHCIATVNGMTHRLSSSTEGTFVLGGCKSGRILNDNQTGLLDFSMLGPIDTVSLTAAMRINPVADLEARDSIYLNVGIDLLDKTVFLSLGGYFFALSDAYQVVGEQTLKINVRNLNLPARYYEGKGYVDWSTVYTPDTTVPESVDVEEFYSDATIGKLLDMPQSFLVLLDASGVQVTYQTLDKAQLPGVYYAYGDTPVAPVVVDLGRMPEYVPVTEVDQHVIKFNGYFTRHPQRELVNLNDLTVLENQFRTPGENQYANARFMLIQK